MPCTEASSFPHPCNLSCRHVAFQVMLSQEIVSHNCFYYTSKQSAPSQMTTRDNLLYYTLILKNKCSPSLMTCKRQITCINLKTMFVKQYMPSWTFTHVPRVFRIIWSANALQTGRNITGGLLRGVGSGLLMRSETNTSHNCCITLQNQSASYVNTNL
jgi:hypothetical protein